MSASEDLAHDDTERQARLRALHVLDSEPEEAFDAIARLAAQTCNAPIALLTFIDGDRQWFKAVVGVPGVRQTPRNASFCGHAIVQDGLLEVPDARCDPRFADLPCVQGHHGIRFYAGVPLVLEGGVRVGTLCVLDARARTLEASQADMLRALADIATKTLTMRAALIEKTLAVRTAQQQALAEVADEMADLYDNAPCAYHSLDAQGRYARVNNTALAWMECTREEVVGKLRITDFMDEGGVALFHENFPRLMRDGFLGNQEFELVGRNGSRRRVVCAATAIRDRSGAYTATRTVMHDITELQRAKDALRDLADEQHAILHTDLIGMMKIRDRKIVWANRGAEHMFGYGPGELLGMPTRMLYQDSHSHEEGGRLAYSNTQVRRMFRGQVEGVTKGGQHVIVDVSGTPTREDPGQMLCILVDITALKQAEDIRMRTLALEAENRQLVEVGRVKGMFLSNMSHELRTPLNAVIGYAHLLQAGSVRPDSPKFTHFLNQIGSSGRQLLALIDTVLNFASAEAGKLTLRLETVHLASVINSAVETLLAEGRKKAVRIEVEIDEGLGEFAADELRLSQLVSHYVSNAVKFSHEGGQVTVRAWMESADDLRIEVEDAGIGIAEADIGRLFTPFQQLSEGNTKAYAGAGLGLALTRRLVEAHGGKVGVTSRLGVGSVFWAVLPHRRPVHMPVERPATPQ